MNYLDALKSSLPYRRKCWRDGRWREAIHYDSNWKICYTETLQDLIADDWEIQEPSVPLSRSQFWEAYGTALKSIHLTMNIIPTETRLMDDVLWRMTNQIFGEVPRGPTNPP